MQQFENFDHDPEEYIRYCWMAITMHFDKPRALWFATKGQEFLDAQEIDGDTAEEMLDQLYRKGMGYHALATAYVWNDHFDEAHRIEEHFLGPSYWLPFKEYIGQYLVMLMIKGLNERLAKLFSDPQFKYGFLPWWEAYASLFIDPHTPITRMSETVPIINSVVDGRKTYG